MSRAVSPVVGVVLLVAVTLALAGALCAAALALPPADLHVPRHVVLSVSADASGRITLTHAGGATLDVRDLTLRVTVDGEPLRYQPPVPYFAAEGFRGGPTGPFNVAADPRWSTGESASLWVAGTNTPSLDPGDTVVVRLYRDGLLIAVARTGVVSKTASGRVRLSSRGRARRW